MLGEGDDDQFPNENDDSMVSWFDDAYGTLYKKHRLGSSNRQQVNKSPDSNIINM